MFNIVSEFEFTVESTDEQLECYAEIMKSMATHYDDLSPKVFRESLSNQRTRAFYVEFDNGGKGVFSVGEADQAQKKVVATHRIANTGAVGFSSPEEIRDNMWVWAIAKMRSIGVKSLLIVAPSADRYTDKMFGQFVEMTLSPEVLQTHGDESGKISKTSVKKTELRNETVFKTILEIK